MASPLPPITVRKSIFYLTFTLILLPLLVSYLITRHALNRNSLCIVGPAATTTDEGNEWYGIYQLHPSNAGTYVRVIDNSISFGYHYFGTKWRVWPSLMALGDLISPLSLRERLQAVDRRVGSSIQRSSSSFCLYAKDNSICSEDVDFDVSEVVPSPPSGTWVRSQNSNGSSATKSVSVRVKCHDPKPSPRKQKKKRRKKEKKGMYLLVNQPATVCLGLVNVALAYFYWNHHVQPSIVAISFNKMFNSNMHELWRAYSGTFAHFDLLHIAFNMMTLSSLGGVEELIGSMNYLLISLTLVIYTVSLMMLATYYQMKHGGNTEAGEKQTVGYSGILFAWTVVATLEQGNSCPIPFLSDLCFDTWSFGPLRFNIAPIAQLLFIQMLVRRASFIGHLSGMLCGYLLHWNFFTTLMLDTASVVTVVSVGYLWRVKQYIPWNRGLDANDNDHQNEQSPNKYLCRGQSMITFVSSISLIFFDLTLAFPLLILSCLYFNGVQALKNSKSMRKGVVETILTAFFVGNVILILSDCASIGQWISFHLYLQGYSSIPSSLVFLFAALRVSVNSFCLCIAATTISCPNLFIKSSLGSILSWSENIGKWVLAPPAQEFTAFDGIGRSTGTFAGVELNV